VKTRGCLKRSVVPAVLWLATASPGARAQQPPTFAASTEVVAVPVFVLNAAGQPVPSLTQDQFQVKVDGHPATIVAFEEIDALEAPEAPGDTPPAPQPTALQATAVRQFLFLFDLTFSDPGQLKRARRAAADIIQHKLGPRDLIAVATLSARAGFREVLGFTPDRDQALRAVMTLGFGQPKTDARDPLGLSFEMSSIASQGGGLTASGFDDLRTIQDDEHIDQLREVVEREQQIGAEDLSADIRDLAKALGRIQGHKQVVLFSTGFHAQTLFGSSAPFGDQRPGANTSQTASSDAHFGDAVLTQTLREAFDAFVANDVAVHTIAVQGLETGSDLTDQAGLGSAAGRVNLGQDSLAQFSANSGGLFVKGHNDLGVALASVMDASRRFYLLGITAPAGGKPGHVRHIDVAVTRSGVRVFHRLGFVESKSPGPVRLATRPEAAEWLVKGLTGGELPVRSLAMPVSESHGGARVALLLEVDHASLGGESAALPALEFYAYAFDARGRVTDLAAVEPTAQALASLARSGPKRLVFATSLGATPGIAEVRFVLRESGSGRFGAGRVRIEVPDFAAPKPVPVLSPPLLIGSFAGAAVLRVKPRSGEASLPFALQGQAFLPALDPVVRRGEPSQLLLLYWDKHLASDVALDVQLRLVNGAGEALPPGPVRLVASATGTDGLRRMLVELTPASLPPGDYRLQVEAHDPASGISSRAQEALHLR